jgi:hypothetical protein
MTYGETEPGDSERSAGPGWDTQFGTRLASVIADVGGVTKASAIVDVKPESISKWRDGKARAPFLAIAALAARADVSLDWLATGAGSKRRGEVPVQSHGWDATLMRECIKSVEELLVELDRELDADAKTDLIFEVYGEELERKQKGQRLSATEVVRILKRAG